MVVENIVCSHDGMHILELKCCLIDIHLFIICSKTINFFMEWTIICELMIDCVFANTWDPLDHSIVWIQPFFAMVSQSALDFVVSDCYTNNDSVLIEQSYTACETHYHSSVVLLRLWCATSQQFIRTRPPTSFYGYTDERFTFSPLNGLYLFVQIFNCDGERNNFECAFDVIWCVCAFDWMCHQIEMIIHREYISPSKT